MVEIKRSLGLKKGFPTKKGCVHHQDATCLKFDHTRKNLCLHPSIVNHCQDFKLRIIDNLLVTIPIVWKKLKG